jgi:MYXO-CTERM domain-containing protein
MSGKKTQPGFTAQIKALDDVRVERVEISIDGAMIGMATTEITNLFEIPTPRELGQGTHTMDARAFDVQGILGTTTVTFEQGPPCDRDDGCEGADVCVEGICIPGPDVPGGLGSVCTSDTECLSHRCVDGGEEFKRCVEECTIGNKESCPDDFVCADAGAAGVCWLHPGGCCSIGSGAAGPMLLGLGVMALVLRRRPRRR